MARFDLLVLTDPLQGETTVDGKPGAHVHLVCTWTAASDTELLLLSNHAALLYDSMLRHSSLPVLRTPSPLFFHSFLKISLAGNLFCEELPDSP